MEDTQASITSSIFNGVAEMWQSDNDATAV